MTSYPVLQNPPELVMNLDAPAVGASKCANPRLPDEIIEGPNLARQESSRSLKTVIVQAGDQRFVLAVTQDPNDESLGLMCVEHLKGNSGMLFDLHTSHTAQMWMKNTLVPLDIVWTTRTGIVTSIARDVAASTMTTRNDEVARVSGTGRFVIELPADAAAAAGITLGSKIDFIR